MKKSLNTLVTATSSLSLAQQATQNAPRRNWAVWTTVRGEDRSCEVFPSLRKANVYYKASLADLREFEKELGRPTIFWADRPTRTSMETGFFWCR